MAQFKPPDPPKPKVPRFRANFKFMKDEAASTRSGNTCRCGSKSFRQVHRIDQPKGGTSIMYECTECGEYSI